MEKLIIKPTNFSPGVVLNPAENTFEITGDSRPENAASVYGLILDWLDKYY